jgi:energy-coupling factor transport system permease protein
MIFSTRGVLGYALAVGCVALVCALAGISPRFLIRSLRSLTMLIAMTAVLNLFFTRTGSPLVSIWRFRITDEGLRLAAYFALRLIFLVTGTTLLTLTTSPIALTDALESLMRPLERIRFPAHELAMMMSIALRFIPTLTEETDKIMKAQASRGADFESGSLLKRAKALTPLLAPLFISAFRRAGDLALAMESRCYQGGEGRTRMRELRYARADAIAFASMIVMLALIFLERILIR